MIGAFAAASGLLVLVDSRLPFLAIAALLLAAVSLLRDRSRVFLPVLALAFVALHLLGFFVSVDSPVYFAYTSSLLADRDLDFENQWARLALNITWPNPQPIGPGLLWAPAVGLTHLWLLATGGVTDPLVIGPPYFAAAAATTLAVALAGTFLLARTLALVHGPVPSWLAVIASIGASPILYYLTVLPLMAHGLTFGLTAITLALTLRTEREGTLRAWAWCGAALGLAVLCRTQAAVLVLFVFAGLWRSRASIGQAGLTVFCALGVFSPQFLVWRILHGSFVTLPQEEGYIDLTRQHVIDVLLSADRGLFNWHPMLLLGLFGLVVVVRGRGAYCLAALVIFGVTAFVNGTVRDWNGSDAFGARRFDVVIPLFAFGMAGLFDRMRRHLVRRPLLVPAAVIAAATLWNASLIDLRKGRTVTAIPLSELASLQTEQVRRAADATAGRLGPEARAVIYKMFVGLFAYDNYWPGGDFDLSTLEPRFLGKGWSEVEMWEDGAKFRYLLYPEGCLLIPLNEPFDLRGHLLARAPARIPDQRLTVLLNDRVLTVADVGAVWTEIPFEAPQRLWNAGENRFCVRAAKKRPGDEGDDLSYAAAVVRVQLP